MTWTKIDVRALLLRELETDVHGLLGRLGSVRCDDDRLHHCLLLGVGRTLNSSTPRHNPGICCFPGAGFPRLQFERGERPRSAPGARGGWHRPQLGALARRAPPAPRRDGGEPHRRAVRGARRHRPERPGTRAVHHDRDRRGDARGDRRPSARPRHPRRPHPRRRAAPTPRPGGRSPVRRLSSAPPAHADVPRCAGAPARDGLRQPLPDREGGRRGLRRRGRGARRAPRLAGGRGDRERAPLRVVHALVEPAPGAHPGSGTPSRSRSSRPACSSSSPASCASSSPRGWRSSGCPTGRELEARAVVGRRSGEDVVGLRVGLESSKAGRVFREGRLHRVDSALDDPEIDQEVARRLGTPRRALRAVDLGRRGRSACSARSTRRGRMSASATTTAGSPSSSPIAPPSPSTSPVASRATRSGGSSRGRSSSGGVWPASCTTRPGRP